MDIFVHFRLFHFGLAHYASEPFIQAMPLSGSTNSYKCCSADVVVAPLTVVLLGSCCWLCTPVARSIKPKRLHYNSTSGRWWRCN